MSKDELTALVQIVNRAPVSAAESMWLKSFFAREAMQVEFAEKMAAKEKAEQAAAKEAAAQGDES